MDNIPEISLFLQDTRKLLNLGLLLDDSSPESLWAALALHERSQKMAGRWSERNRHIIEQYLARRFPGFVSADGKSDEPLH